ncbi:hypothetical protein INR49_024219 [Caranx melampygus]|nr:hypothetical protein INR49_024219 [Caranx melampygus]
MGRFKREDQDICQVMKSLPTVGIVMMAGDTRSHTQSAKTTLSILALTITVRSVMYVQLGLLLYGPATLPLTPSAKCEGATPLIMLLVLLLALSAYIIYMKRKRGSEILSAPLQTVMDNLDVLEKLVILLDPESPGVKNTKHLASHCSFSSAWINYTYSMKESKSPLKAVLEGVTSRHPDWTVGHLAKLLKQMERNDALTMGVEGEKKKRSWAWLGRQTVLTLLLWLILRPCLKRIAMGNSKLVARLKERANKF